MTSKYSLPGTIAVKGWGFGTGTNLKSGSVKKSDFTQHLKRQMVEGNQIKRGEMLRQVPPLLKRKANWKSRPSVKLKLEKKQGR